jgi:hypothetical protein
LVILRFAPGKLAEGRTVARGNWRSGIRQHYLPFQDPDSPHSDSHIEFYISLDMQEKAILDWFFSFAGDNPTRKTPG